jgi:hypothetical protein
MIREDLDNIGHINKIHVSERRDRKMVAYFEVDKNDVDFLNRVFREVTPIIKFKLIENDYLIYLSFPILHYKKDLFTYNIGQESEYYRRLRMNEFEFITASWVEANSPPISYPECHIPYLHPSSQSD